MTDRFSEEDVIALIAGLNQPRLVTFIAAEFVKPQQSDGGLYFGQVDVARLELLCDLSDDLDLNETALGVVISLLDQLHAARYARDVVAQALRGLPEEMRRQILDTMAQS